MRRNPHSIQVVSNLTPLSQKPSQCLTSRSSGSY